VKHPNDDATDGILLAQPDPKKQGEILELCRTSVSALHDLHFLMKQTTGDTTKMSEYVRMSGEHIQKMTDIYAISDD
jgi:hypothetical protein